MDNEMTNTTKMEETINKSNKTKKVIIISAIFLVLCAIGVAVYLGFIDDKYYMGPLRAELSDGTLTISGKGDMPDDIPWIDEKDKITKVVIKDGVTSVGDCVFLSCDSLASVTIPDSVTSIGRYAFAYCNSLKSITIPDSVNSIGTYAFYGCGFLESVTIGDGLNSIGECAFNSCPSLASIVVSSGNKVYHSENNCLIETATKTLIVGCKNSVIPTDGSVTSIGDYAFHNCYSLASITIPDSVNSIGDRVFENCSFLESVTIPDSVNSIGDGAFSGCDTLASVTFKDPNGWYVTETEGASSGIDVDVTDKSTITDYLTAEYTFYYWYKK